MKLNNGHKILKLDKIDRNKCLLFEKILCEFYKLELDPNTTPFACSPEKAVGWLISTWDAKFGRLSYLDSMINLKPDIEILTELDQINTKTVITASIAKNFGI